VTRPFSDTGGTVCAGRDRLRETITPAGPLQWGSPVRRFAIAIFALLSLLPRFASADSGSWGARGISHRFLVRGDLVFDADGRGISVYDTANPAQIRRAGSATTDDETLDLAFLGPQELAILTARSIDRYSVSPAGEVRLLSTLPQNDNLTRLASSASGSYLAAATANSVTVWSVTTESLTIAARVPVTGTVTAVAFHQDNVVFAVADQGVFVVDTRSGELIATIGVNARDLIIQNDTLYAAGGPNGLVLVNLGDERSPSVISRTGAGDIDLERIAVGGTHAFTVQGNDLVRIFDVSALENPRLTATFHVQAGVIAANASHLFLSGAVVDAFGLRNESGVPLRVYSLTDPANPTVAGEVQDLAGPVSGVATDGTLAYVADPPYFRVIDVSNPAAPKELSSVRLATLQDRVKLSGNRVIVFGRGDVDLFDVSDPYHARLAGIFVSYGRPPSNAAFAGVGNTIIEGNPWSGFHVVDFDYFGDPTRPVQIAGIKGHYKEIVGRGDHAYLFGDPSGMRAVDLSARGEANVVHDFTTPTEQAEVVGETARHSELLLAGAADGLRIFDAADPLDPRQVAFQPLSQAPVFGSAGDTSWLAIDGHLWSLDLKGSWTMSQASMRVSSPMQVSAAENGKIVVADRYSLRVFGPVTAPPPPPKPARGRAARH
jgi:hypothetical protein